MRDFNVTVNEDDVDGVKGLPQKCAAVNLASDTVLEQVGVGILVGVAGHVKVRLAGDAEDSAGVLLKNMTAGVIHRLAVTKIFSTGNGTTATDVVVFY